jgi:hypothetical protein
MGVDNAQEEEDGHHEAYGAMVHRGLREREAGHQGVEAGSARPASAGQSGVVGSSDYAAGFKDGQEEILGRPAHAPDARLSLHNAIAEELGVPAGTEALWKATDWVLMRLWADGFKVISFDPEPFGVEADNGC